MFHVYLLRSQANPRKTYVGMTNTAVENRLKAHNKGECASTTRSRPWELVAVVGVQEKGKALKLERYFKSGSGHAFAHKHLW